MRNDPDRPFLLTFLHGEDVRPKDSGIIRILDIHPFDLIETVQKGHEIIGAGTFSGSAVGWTHGRYLDHARQVPDDILFGVFDSRQDVFYGHVHSIVYDIDKNLEMRLSPQCFQQRRTTIVTAFPPPRQRVPHPTSLFLFLRA